MAKSGNQIFKNCFKKNDNKDILCFGKEQKVNWEKVMLDYEKNEGVY